MTTARQRHLIRVLEKRYGIVGKVAGRYVAAGLHATLMHPTRYGPAHVVVQGNGQKLVVEVVERWEEAAEAAERLVKKAELLRARPVLALYGYGVLPPEVSEKIRGLGVKIKYVRP